MDLTKIAKKRDDKAPRKFARFYWLDDVWFELFCVDRKLVKGSQKKSVDPEKPFRWNEKHQKEENVDDERFDANLTFDTIKNIGGLKVKHLKEILDPNKIDFAYTKEQAEADVECNDTNKTFICENSSFKFSNWVAENAMDLAAFSAKQQEAELKNSPKQPKDSGCKETSRASNAGSA